VVLVLATFAYLMCDRSTPTTLGSSGYATVILPMSKGQPYMGGTLFIDVVLEFARSKVNHF
jgi:hypothetical protein